MLGASDLVSRVRSYLPESDLKVLETAYLFAEYAHRDQKRKSGDPYFIHPVNVAATLADMQLDVASVAAGLLHDVVEDTETSVREIKDSFGTEISELVDGLTKLNKINFYSKEDRQAESFRKMVVAMAKDVRVLLVKLCDRLDNMRTMDHMSPSSQERISRETTEIYAPLAHHLGMNRIKNELEDLSLRYLEPQLHDEITTKLGNGRRERERYIEGVCRTIKHLLGERGLACEVVGKPRHVTSVQRKMTSLKCGFEQVFDLVAFHVCVESSTECYTTLGVVHSKWMPVPGRFKDYIALPKANRYQSLHTVVIGPGKKRLELHIRTHEMDRVAEKGVLAHWEYRAAVSGRVRPEEASRYNWLREMESYQRELKDPAEFLELVKSSLFPDEVFVFTPAGEMKTLPRGATPLDFAYCIHTEVGHHCSGARVNGQMVPIRYRLRNGDIIEILTDDKQWPAKDWPEACTTPKARNRVRNYLRVQNRRKSINLGRELLETEMQRAGMSLTKLGKNGGVVQPLLEALNVRGFDELLLAVGFGKLQAHDIVTNVRQLRTGSPESGRPVPELRPSPIEKIIRKVRGSENNGIRVDSQEDVLARFAKCCNPLHGDPIIGFITRGRGVAIHRRVCSKAFDTTDPERRVDVSWGAANREKRPASISVMTRNSPGILAKVSQVFLTLKINLTEANCRASDDGSAQNVFTFLAGDVEQLRSVIKALKQIEGVVAVERV